MNELNTIIDLMGQHRRENKAEFAELRHANAQVADAVSQMAQAMVRAEERHARHDDGIKRIGRQVDDHETRIRAVEGTSNKVVGGWKVVGIIGTGLVALVSGIWAIWQAVG